MAVKRQNLLNMFEKVGYNIFNYDQAEFEVRQRVVGPKQDDNLLEFHLAQVMDAETPTDKGVSASNVAEVTPAKKPRTLGNLG